MYQNIPLFYTSTTTTNSGIANVRGNIVHPSFGFTFYDPIIKFKVYYLYNPSLVYFIDTWYYPNNTYISKKNSKTILVSSGIENAGRGFIYFNYLPDNYALLQICNDDNYLFAATTKGLEVYSMYTNKLVCKKDVGGYSVSSVGISGKELYIGTPEGLYTLDTTDPCSNAVMQSSYEITSNNITYLACGDDKLLVCTVSGVDFFRLDKQPVIHSKTTASGTKKCFVIGNAGYYITTEFGIDVLNKIVFSSSDWDIPTATYKVGGGIFKSGIELTDIFVTYRTGYNQENTIFCATTSGIYIIDEGNLNFTIYTAN